MRSDNSPHRDQVPLLDLKAQYAPLRDDILSAITRVCDSQRFIMGPEVDGLERELSAMLGVRHAVAVSSGTDALLLALMALGVTHGDEVITSAYSFFATAGAVARLGATPVFVDIDLDTYNLDVRQLPSAITSRTKAILPVHLFGLPADMNAVLDAASRSGIAVVEDAAQAIGATYHGRSAGSIGTCGCFSFFPSKNLGAFGDAGLFTTNDDALAGRARIMRVHGSEPKYYHSLVGGNFRMDALQAAILRVKTPHLEAWTEARRKNASRYDALIRGAGLTDRIAVPIIDPPNCRHIFNQYVVRTPRRDDLRAHLTAHGIGTEVYYPVPLHLQPCFSYLGYRQGSFPRAELAAAESLALPIYGELTRSQQESVVDVIATFVNNTAAASSSGPARA